MARWARRVLEVLPGQEVSPVPRDRLVRLALAEFKAPRAFRESKAKLALSAQPGRMVRTVRAALRDLKEFKAQPAQPVQWV